METEVRRIAVMVGSNNDLKWQCGLGLDYLKRMVVKDQAEIVDVATVETEVPAVITASIHRNTRYVLDRLETYNNALDVLITGAGWANHLSGTVDAYLRNWLENSRTVVLGVAFEDLTSEDADTRARHLLAAKLSISEVPGTQVVWQDKQVQFVGADGFYRACRFAVTGELPIITIPNPRESHDRTLDEALAYIRGS